MVVDRTSHGTGSMLEVFNANWKKYTFIAISVMALAGSSYLLFINVTSPQVRPMNSVSGDTEIIAEAIRSSRAVSSYNLSLDSVNSYDDYGDGWYMVNITFSDANNAGKTTYDMILKRSSDGSYDIVIDIDEDPTGELMAQRNIPEAIRKKIDEYRSNNAKGDHE